MKSHAQKKFDAKPQVAIVDAKFATIFQGKRVVQFYRSGQFLKGRIADRKDGML